MPNPPRDHFGPNYDELHVDSGGKHYVHEDDWNEVLRNFRTWKENVNAGGFNLGGVGALTCASLSASGAVSTGAFACTTLTASGAATFASLKVTNSVTEIAGTIPITYWRETGAAANSRLWKGYVYASNMVFSVANDADTAESPWLRVYRVGSTATGAVFPYGISVGIGASPAATLYVYRVGTDEHIRFSNDATYFYGIGRRSSDGYCVLAGNQASPASGFVLSLGGAERFVITPTTAYLDLATLPIYADKTAAASLPNGRLYRTAAGTLMVKVP